MMKKASILLLVLLASLPGCGRKSRMQGDYKRGRVTAQNADQFDTVNLALAQGDDLEVDESMRNFFLNDMNEFAELNGEDFALVEATENLQGDQLAWHDATTKEFETIYFGYDKDRLDKKEREKVEKNVAKLKQMLADAGADAKVVINGFTCLYGTDAYDLALSDRRAKTVKDQLVAAGISPDQIKAVGRGKEMPKVTEGTREEQWVNRRVEMHVIHA